jgi:hypothetical protein
MNAAGTYTWGVMPDTADPDDPSFNFTDYVVGGEMHGEGTWAIHPTVSSRILFTETGYAALTGTVYPGKTMLIDEGPANGLTLGIRYPDAPIPQAQIAGTYRFIDATADGATGIGWYSIPASGGTVPWWEQLDDGSPAASGTSTGFQMYSRLYGAGWLLDDFGPPDHEQFYTTIIVLPGQILMHFCYRIDVDPYELVSYGVGARIN